MYYCCQRFCSILFIACMLLSLIGCASKDKLTISTKQETFTISLPSNPTTGFQWSVISYDKSIFDLINHQYIASKIGVIGAGGTMLFTFKFKKQLSYPRVSKIKFKHARSWEPESATYKEIEVFIKS